MGLALIGCGKRLNTVHSACAWLYITYCIQLQQVDMCGLRPGYSMKQELKVNTSVGNISQSPSSVHPYSIIELVATNMSFGKGVSFNCIK